ncbi:MAG TPA: hypothetical protein V6D22_26265 [Candidatus Obscuribacterales bacterium]
MLRLLARLLLSALVFIAVLPHVPGIAFHGTFFQALMLAIMFALILWLVDMVAIALSAVAAIGTLGLALLWLIPFWILGFWLLPAVALKVVSDLMPSYLTISGWLPAIFGGLIMMFIGMVTSGHVWRDAAV